MPRSEAVLEISLLDFDRTVADTFASPSGIVGVEGAYRSAVSDVLGVQAVDDFDAQGGLRNRAPGELAQALTGRGIAGTELTELTGKLVAAKMGVLTGQISDRWPLPVLGFLDYWELVQGAEGIETGIVSSGHTGFIVRVFEQWGIELPGAVVTDDELHEIDDPTPYEQRVKPSPFGLRTAVAEVLGVEGCRVDDPSFISQAFARRISFAGDDPKKDGKMAKNAGVNFFHIDPLNPTTGYEQLTQFHGLHFYAK